MRDQIVVTGGTGLLGRAAVQRLLDAGREVRVLSRRHRPAHDRAGYAWATADLGSGHGVREAVTGAGVIVHCATAFGRRAEARVVEDLVRAARRVGSPHLVYIFIVGVDRVPLAYHQGKLAAQRSVQRSGPPYTILRSTQFDDLLRAVFARAASSPVLPVPGLRFQPNDVGEVADHLAGLAVGEPAGHAADLAGAAGTVRRRPGPRIPAGHRSPAVGVAILVAGHDVLGLPGRRPPGAGTRGWEGHIRGAPCHARRSATLVVPGAAAMTARTWLRAGLVCLAVAQGLAGAVQLPLPRAFYNDLPWPGHPWVAMLPPYNEHLMRDVGALTLAYTLVLGIAAVSMERRMVRTVLAANLVFAVPHFAFHAAHPAHFTTADAVAQTATLALGRADPGRPARRLRTTVTAPRGGDSGAAEKNEART